MHVCGSWRQCLPVYCCRSLKLTALALKAYVHHATTNAGPQATASLCHLRSISSKTKTAALAQSLPGGCAAAKTLLLANLWAFTLALLPSGHSSTKAAAGISCLWTTSMKRCATFGASGRLSVRCAALNELPHVRAKAFRAVTTAYWCCPSLLVAIAVW